MGLRVSGKNMDVGESLRSTAEARMAAALLKYASRGGGANALEGGDAVRRTLSRHEGHVVIERDGFGYRADCVVHLEGVTLHATALAADAYESFERCAERIEKRLRRHGRRLKDRREGREQAGREQVGREQAGGRGPGSADEAAAGSGAARPNGAGDLEDRAGRMEPGEDIMRSVILAVPGLSDDLDDGDDEDNEDAEGGAPRDRPEPVVVAETEARLPAWSVREAVEELDHTGAPVIVFRHATSERVNIVYRRPDGNVGWVDPGGATPRA